MGLFSRYTDEASKQRARQRLVWLGRFLDNAVTIPGTSHRVGADAIIGLVPGIGDVVTSLMSSYIVYEAWRLGAGGKQVALMVGNVALDLLISEVPILGDIGDVYFKANVRNLRMLGIDCGVRTIAGATDGSTGPARAAPSPGEPAAPPDAPPDAPLRKRVANEAA